MAHQQPPRSVASKGDGWHAFGYVVSGVGFYGLLGWLADQWLDTSFLVAVGLVLGAGLGVWMTWKRFSHEPDPDPTALTQNVTTQETQ